MSRLRIRNFGFAAVLFGSLPGAGCPNVPNVPDAGPVLDGGLDSGGDSGPISTQDASLETGVLEAGPKPVEAGPTPVDAGPTVLDAGPPGSCSLACSNLKTLGCDEGIKTSCVSTCLSATLAKLTNLHTDCLGKARSKAEARKCGSVTCP
jgi:hypothetical protein